MSAHCPDCGAVASYGQEIGHRRGCPALQRAIAGDPTRAAKGAACVCTFGRRNPNCRAHDWPFSALPEGKTPMPIDREGVLDRCRRELLALRATKETPAKDIWDIGYQKAIDDAVGILGILKAESLSEGHDEVDVPSDRDAPSDELVETVAKAHYDKTIGIVAITRPGAPFLPWGELPEEQRRISMAGARAAIEAYRHRGDCPARMV